MKVGNGIAARAVMRGGGRADPADLPKHMSAQTHSTQYIFVPLSRDGMFCYK